MRFGISTHLFHNEKLAEPHLAAFSEHGFDTVEFFATKTHVDYGSDAHTQQIVRWLADAGLTAHSVHAPITSALCNGSWGDVWSNASADAGRRQIAVAESVKAMAFAAAVGAKFVVVHLGVPDGMQTPGPDNDGAAVSRSLGLLAADARAHGVTLALEVIPNRLSTPDALVARLEAAADAIDEAGALAGHGVCLDTGHAHMMGGVIDAAETLGGHLVTMHIHDNAGRRDDHLVPFQGTIDWSACVMALEKVGYDGVWMFEIAAPESAGPDGAAAVLKRAAVARERLEKLSEPIEFELS
ncbi:MAG: sugar phosphate isomerase/epimerase [Acidobacteriota bacterium]|nr:sugar phosphate isomerase/epimerase [Acidobacteriota bacterium]